VGAHRRCLLLLPASLSSSSALEVPGGWCTL